MSPLFMPKNQTEKLILNQTRINAKADKIKRQENINLTFNAVTLFAFISGLSAFLANYLAPQKNSTEDAHLIEEKISESMALILFTAITLTLTYSYFQNKITKEKIMKIKDSRQEEHLKLKKLSEMEQKTSSPFLRNLGINFLLLSGAICIEKYYYDSIKYFSTSYRQELPAELPKKLRTDYKTAMTYHDAMRILDYLSLLNNLGTLYDPSGQKDYTYYISIETYDLAEEMEQLHAKMTHDYLENINTYSENTPDKIKIYVDGIMAEREASIRTFVEKISRAYKLAINESIKQLLARYLKYITGLAFSGIALYQGYNYSSEKKQKQERQEKYRLIQEIFDSTTSDGELKDEYNNSSSFALYAIQLPERINYKNFNINPKEFIEFLEKNKLLRGFYGKNQITFNLDELSLAEIKNAKKRLPELFDNFIAAKQKEKVYGDGAGQYSFTENIGIKNKKVVKGKNKEISGELEIQEDHIAGKVVAETNNTWDGHGKLIIKINDEIYAYPPDEKIEHNGQPANPLFRSADDARGNPVFSAVPENVIEELENISGENRTVVINKLGTAFEKPIGKNSNSVNKPVGKTEQVDEQRNDDEYSDKMRLEKAGFKGLHNLGLYARKLKIYEQVIVLGNTTDQPNGDAKFYLSDKIGGRAHS